MAFFLLSLSVVFLCSCSSKSNQNADKEADIQEVKSSVDEKKVQDDRQQLTSDQLAELLPENISGYPIAQQILKTPDDVEKVGASRQYLDKEYKAYIKVSITDYPQPQEDYEKAWSYNKSFENDSRKTTVTQKDGVDIYEVIMKDSKAKFTTFAINHRFEVYIESNKLDDIQLHYDVAEPIIDKLKKTQ